jgi:hypothetical protein
LTPAFFTFEQRNYNPKKAPKAVKKALTVSDLATLQPKKD